MAQKKIVKKEKKKDDLDPNNDEFMVKSMTFLDWAVERRKQLGAILILALLVAVGSIVFDHVTESSASSASALLGAGLEVAVAPVRPSDGDDIPEEVDDDETWFETNEAKASESLKLFKIVTEKEAGSAYASMAELNIAAAYHDSGKYDEAIKHYESFLGSIDSSTEWLRPNALEGLGQALEATDKLDLAQAKYKELGEKGQGGISLMGKYNEARIIEKKGDDKDAAIALLKEVIDSIREDGGTDKFNYLFVEARERLLALDPNAVVPDLPSGMDFNNMDPAMLQRLLQAQQAAAGSAAP